MFENNVTDERLYWRPNPELLAGWSDVWAKKFEIFCHPGLNFTAINNKQNISGRKMKLHKLDWLEWITILLCGWFLLYPTPYKVLFTIILLLPVIGLILHDNSKPSITSLISITTNKDGETAYDVVSFIALPAYILILRMFLDYEIESYFDLLIEGLILLIAFLIIIGFFYRDIEKENSHKALIYFVILGNIAIYSIGAVYGINCVYDNSKPKVYQVPVVDKSIYSGRHKSYYLYVEPWSNKSDNDKIDVSKNKYDRTMIGDTVKVDSRVGLLKIPWHNIE